MRIFYITDLVLDDRSAPAVHVDAICAQFAALGHKVRLYAPSAGKFAIAKPYPISYITTPRFLLSLFFQPRLFLRLWLDIRAVRPDMIYARHSHLLIVPVIIGTIFRIPVVLEINGILEQDARHIQKTALSWVLLYSGVFSLLERLNARLASRLIAVTPGIKDYFLHTYQVREEQIVVIENGVDTERFTPMDMQQARKELRLDPGAVCVGYIGSLHEWQGVRYIAECAAANSARYPIVRFVIVGDGEMRENLAIFIRERNLTNIELRGAVSHDQVPLYINAFDVCISYPLSFRDGATSPFKVYEYLACGKPVVSSDLPSIRGEFGDILTYAKAESAPDLCSVLSKLIENKATRDALGRNGRAFIENGHSWRAVAEKIIAASRGQR